MSLRPVSLNSPVLLSQPFNLEHDWKNDSDATCFFLTSPQVVLQVDGQYYVYIDAVRGFKPSWSKTEPLERILSVDQLIVEVDRFKRIFGQKEFYRSTITAVMEQVSQLRNLHESLQKSWLHSFIRLLPSRLNVTTRPMVLSTISTELTHFMHGYATSTTVLCSLNSQGVRLTAADLVLWIGIVTSKNTKPEHEGIEARGLLVYRNGQCWYEKGDISFKELCSGRSEAIKELLGESGWKLTQDFTTGQSKEGFSIEGPNLIRMLVISGMELHYVTYGRDDLDVNLADTNKS